MPAPAVPCWSLPTLISCRRKQPTALKMAPWIEFIQHINVPQKFVRKLVSLRLNSCGNAKWAKTLCTTWRNFVRFFLKQTPVRCHATWRPSNNIFLLLNMLEPEQTKLCKSLCWFISERKINSVSYWREDKLNSVNASRVSQSNNKIKIRTESRIFSSPSSSGSSLTKL